MIDKLIDLYISSIPLMLWLLTACVIEWGMETIQRRQAMIQVKEKAAAIREMATASTQKGTGESKHPQNTMVRPENQEPRGALPLGYLGDQCTICGKPIGSDRYYMTNRGKWPAAYAHVACLHFRTDREEQK